MTDKNLLEVNSSNVQNPFIEDKNIIPSIDPNSLNKPNISISSTEINSNKKIEIAQNYTPKKNKFFKN